MNCVRDNVRCFITSLSIHEFTWKIGSDPEGFYASRLGFRGRTKRHADFRFPAAMIIRINSRKSSFHSLEMRDESNHSKYQDIKVGLR